MEMSGYVRFVRFFTMAFSCAGAEKVRESLV